MKFIGIIPARYASTRFPGKPLALLGGKPVIQHVYEKVAAVLEAAYVATDDERIYDVVKSFGGQVVMTRTDHKSGTDRIEEAIEKIGGEWDVVVNVQGDEPFVAKNQLDTICHCFDDPTTQIATLGKPFESMEAVQIPTVRNRSRQYGLRHVFLAQCHSLCTRKRNVFLAHSLPFPEASWHLCLSQGRTASGYPTATKLA